mmetsp:Transcript_23151/g.38815  ORF Transcript_23151/g.38815 Transcript_23151/m.38815 type:complete len:462 (-) Transcript_23151:222-1607(-)
MKTRSGVRYTCARPKKRRREGENGAEVTQDVASVETLHSPWLEPGHEGCARYIEKLEKDNDRMVDRINELMKILNETNSPNPCLSLQNDDNLDVTCLLPDDLLIRIIMISFPAPSYLLLQRVCRRWHSLISTSAHLLTTTLDLSRVALSSAERICAMLDILPNIRTISLDLDRNWDAILSSVAQSCPSLTSLSMGFGSPFALEPLCRGCSSIEKLWLRYLHPQHFAPVDVVGTLCSGLKVLCLKKCSLSSSGFRTLMARSGSTLQELNVQSTQLPPDWVSTLLSASPYLLRSLALSTCGIGRSDASLMLQGLPFLEALRIVDLTRSFVWPDHATLPKLSLQILDLRFASISDAAACTLIAACPNLRMLRLGHCRHVTDISGKFVARHCPHLETIDMSSSSIGEVTLAELSMQKCPPRHFIYDASSFVGNPAACERYLAMLSSKGVQFYDPNIVADIWSWLY